MSELAPKVCPTCGRPITTGPRRICFACGGPIGQHHRYHFEGGRVMHNDCNAPKGYVREESAPLLDAQRNENSLEGS
jgi:hypothetical protein